MTIKVVGKANPPVTHYRVTCTDRSCRNIIEFDSTDVTTQRISCMGRIIGEKEGIGCPDCAQIMIIEEAEVIE